MEKIASVKFISYEESIPSALEKIGAGKVLSEQSKIILKPNLTCNRRPPVTTPVDFVREVLRYCLEYSKADILIAEGSGGSDTWECYRNLGYLELARQYGIKLVDLNEEEVVSKRSSLFKKFDYIHFPKILEDGFLISLPVLKDHREAKVTISLKNMLGCFPNGKYKGEKFEGSWKVKMHRWLIDYSIHDICVCKLPDLAVVDASVGQRGGEIWGTPEKFDLILAGDPIEVDKKGAAILGKDWKKVKHIRWIDELVRKHLA
ncbi:DUF362 domain-containing protein [Candidatus Aerophobetes bacterium]|uniref:DUF362 domain-containing protein n=1 Tax=Aerophobetes bacterium TaxID=2030807 RepID=A0A497E4V3_UNCAE|nr:MAG: DUF362 domain-containing protein [Candidatus Aerophobetes bacterium]